MSLDHLIAGIKAHPEIARAGMILCHNGIVRESDRSGSKHVRALNVVVDRTAIERIRSWGESQPGIVAVAIEAFEGEFHVGDDLLFVVVAGDVRENVSQSRGRLLKRSNLRAFTRPNCTTIDRVGGPRQGKMCGV